MLQSLVTQSGPFNYEGSGFVCFLLGNLQIRKQNKLSRI